MMTTDYEILWRNIDQNKVVGKTNREESFVVVIPESDVVAQAGLLAVSRQAVQFRFLAIENSLHLKKISHVSWK